MLLGDAEHAASYPDTRRGKSLPPAAWSPRISRRFPLPCDRDVSPVSPTRRPGVRFGRGVDRRPVPGSPPAS
ncbi:hypothetical protein FRUB_04864 [Fimbriiglobus ruber]|uniref:Uncharacterized protein n=1 Tax=Fimbriiglobus ruber TaxID=1908690 RepID=A0A225DHP3_9BACT|nr:hypothetical protein FRUB_04864 [Fimbriiglobus ruber]